MIDDLVFDIGMHNGDDTQWYLVNGFQVVGVEANPSLVRAATKRFSPAIASGRLAIENCAIFNHEGVTSFWVNEELDAWSAVDRAVGGRLGTRCHEITVPCMRLSKLLKKYGVPYFLKSDIERADRFGLEELDPKDLPRYVSVEAHELDYLLLLWKLGYRKFKIVDQMRLNSTFPLFSNEHFHTRMLKHVCWYLDRAKNKFARNLKYSPWGSGPFGEKAEGPWRSFEDVAYEFLHHSKGYAKRGTLNPRSWFDFHAKLG